MTISKIREEIRKACTRLGMTFDKKGYVNYHEENLISTVVNWNVIKRELANGNKLKPDEDGIIKFNAVHSSSALCVNNFAQVKANVRNFSFMNHSNFKEATFHKKLPTGLSLVNFDFYLKNKTCVIGIESKFTEILKSKIPNSEDRLSRYKDRKGLDYLPNEFFTLIQKYIDCDKKLNLDVAQLIEQSISLIKHSNETSKSPILVYIYWQPTNWQNIDKYLKHIEELSIFKNEIEQFIPFTYMSYIDFWKQYETIEIFRESIKVIKNRYELRI